MTKRQKTSGPRQIVRTLRRNGRSTGRRPRDPVAFVLSSGANLGAVQVGMLRALAEHGIHPDLIVGSSVGALNGAALAHGPSLERIDHIEEVWRTADSREIMPRNWMSPARALTRRGEAVHPIDGLRQLIERTLTVPTFEALPTAFQCVATDVINASERWFHEGPLIDAVLASSAMPAVFPTVEVDGGRYFDGAAVNDVPMRRATDLGARTLYVLEVGPLSRPWNEPKRPADTMMQAYWIARRYRFRRELESLPGDVEVHLMPHGDPPSIKLHDFSRTDELIRNAYMASTAYLELVYGPRSAVQRPAPNMMRSAGPANGDALEANEGPPETGDETGAVEAGVR